MLRGRKGDCVAGSKLIMKNAPRRLVGVEVCCAKQEAAIMVA